MLTTNYLTKVPKLSLAMAVSDVFRAFRKSGMTQLPLVAPASRNNDSATGEYITNRDYQPEATLTPATASASDYLRLVALQDLKQRCRLLKDLQAQKNVDWDPYQLTLLDVLGTDWFDEPDSEPTDSRPYLLESQHVFEAIRLFHRHETSLLPVLSAGGHYLGVLTLQTIVGLMNEIVAGRDGASTIVLEVQGLDYSPAQICSIAESVRGKVLSLTLTPVKTKEPQFGSPNYWVTVRLVCTDMQSLVLSYERFGYQISYVFSDQDLNRTSRENFNALMNYLSV